MKFEYCRHDVVADGIKFTDKVSLILGVYATFYCFIGIRNYNIDLILYKSNDCARYYCSAIRECMGRPENQ